MKNLTIFTPTYNRSNLLPRLYESLLHQTDQDFKWMVIDDGSTDDTKVLVDSWIKENIIEITYYYKKNEGMHSAHNLAYEKIDTPFNVCIDSDDCMPKKAVEIINLETKSIQDDETICGIVGLDADLNGKIIGTGIPKHLTKTRLNELYQIHQVKGDKKLVYKTHYIKQTPPYPIYKNEKFVPLDYKYLLLDLKYWLKPTNEILCLVEYQNDGSTKNIFKQYRNNPNGFAFSRISRINHGITWKEKIKNSIHLVSSILFSMNLSLLFRTRYTLLVLSVIPLGILLNLYIRFINKLDS